ncbi:MAG: UDP-N-acetylmuramoyl-L-alanyl-D-glutamate--2,6-diaminopimelate ligase [Desulforhabdus sp.]|jgi:UDP-N-acetylmuramoyl-L-alanyl-D-glutamate--2,6-diaminopimelate ligase|nr:UDP-N-acetylmuramoyl-L-alanyl-D-glutamate--2,6-diaminopimelate ligase [Desulforhabdus sp.]
MSKTLRGLLRNIEPIEVQGDLDIAITGLAQDSRKVREGDLFVAVCGARQDGHRFIPDAVRRGARAVLTENAVMNGSVRNFVRVADSRKALAKLAANFFEHPADYLQLIGVTGTNGKTTTTLLIESILKQNGWSAGVVGTLAYRWADKYEKAPMTTPDSLELNRLFHRMHMDGVTHVVMEVSSHALSLGRIEGCGFRVAIFTNLSQDHLDFHHTMEDYFNAKELLFNSYLHREKGRAAVINRDDLFGERLIGIVKKEDAWTYSIDHSDATVWVRSAEYATAGTQAELVTPKGSIKFHSSLLGRLNLYNALAAASAALALGISPEVISAGLEAVTFVDGRLQRVPVPQHLGFEVVVDYAHTPDAMEKSLTCLREMTKGRLLVVFGCGGDRDRGKRAIMGEVAARLGDVVILTSDNPRSEIPERIIRDIEPGVQSLGIELIEAGKPARFGKGYLLEVDRKRAIEIALSMGAPGDMIFIGGKGHETYQIIGDSIASFDDRVVVRNYFAQSTQQPSGLRDYELDSREVD